MAQENIVARTLKDMLEHGERIVVVDVRKAEAHAEGSIPGSVNFNAHDALHAGDERVSLTSEVTVVTLSRIV